MAAPECRIGTFLRANGGERHVKRFEERVTCVVDPDVISPVHQEECHRNQGREHPQDQLPPHRPLQGHVAHGYGGHSA